jgi:Flp pilus assembly protein TadG
VSRRSRIQGSRGRASGPEAGQGLVELALVLPMVVLLLLAVLDLGRVLYSNHTVAQAAREASRVGVVTPAETAKKYDAIRLAALGSAPGVGLSSTGIYGGKGACPKGNRDTAAPSTCFYPKGTDPGSPIEVNVRVDVPIVTPLVSAILGGSVRIESRSIRYLP